MGDSCTTWDGNCGRYSTITWKRGSYYAGLSSSQGLNTTSVLDIKLTIKGRTIHTTHSDWLAIRVENTTMLRPLLNHPGIWLQQPQPSYHTAKNQAKHSAKRIETTKSHTRPEQDALVPSNLQVHKFILKERLHFAMDSCRPSHRWPCHQ